VKTLWDAGIDQELISELTIGGDSLAGFLVQLIEAVWAETKSRLLLEGKIGVASFK
jgi:hypothetical protein